MSKRDATLFIADILESIGRIHQALTFDNHFR